MGVHGTTVPGLPIFGQLADILHDPAMCLNKTKFNVQGGPSLTHCARLPLPGGNSLEGGNPFSDRRLCSNISED